MPKGPLLRTAAVVNCLTFDTQIAWSACHDFALTSVERRVKVPRQRFAMAAGLLVVNSDLTRPRIIDHCWKRGADAA